MHLLIALTVLINSFLLTSADDTGYCGGNYYNLVINDAAELNTYAKCFDWNSSITCTVPHLSHDVQVDDPGHFVVNAPEVEVAGAITIWDVNPTGGLSLLTPQLVGVEIFQFSNVTFSTPTFQITDASSDALYSQIFVDNTNIRTIGGILKQNTTAILNNNPSLNNVSLSLMEYGSFTAYENGDRCFISLPDWKQGLLYVSGAAYLELPSVQNLNMSSSLTYNSFSMLDLSSLVTAADTEIQGNEFLSALRLDSLTDVENVQIVNNSALTQLSFPELSTITGFFNLSGPFTSVSFPAITHVAAGISITGTSGKFDCSSLSRQWKPIFATSTGSFTCGTAQPTGLPKSTEPGVGAGVALVALLTVAGFFVGRWALRKRQRRLQEAIKSAPSIEEETSGNYSWSNKPELDSDSRYEVSAETSVIEEKTIELPADHGMSEAEERERHELRSPSS